jgi:hypothetical protein
MNRLIYLIIFFSIVSCNQNKSNIDKPNISSEDIVLDKPKDIDKTKAVKITESKVLKQKKNKTISPDFFKINNSDFSQFKTDNSKWFIDTNENSRLYFVPYTDYSITTAILTSKKIKDKKLIRLLQSEGIKMNDLNNTIRLNDIKSDKGIKLGMSTSQIKEVFDMPNSEIINGETKILKWNFVTSVDNLNEKVGGLRPFLEQGLEFKIKMIFVNEKLFTLIYNYEVP